MNKKIIIATFLLCTLIVVLTFVIIWNMSSQAALFIDPQTAQAAKGQNFTIKVNISNVIDLYAWSFRLGWNTTILEVVKITEDNFLKNHGETFFISKTNNTAEYIQVDCTLLGNLPGVNGSGTLATIQFHVGNTGSCDLTLYETMLINSAEQTINHKGGQNDQTVKKLVKAPEAFNPE